MIVFDDADLERALDAVVFMIYSLNGERCTSSSRLLVHERVHDAFVARLAAGDDPVSAGRYANAAAAIATTGYGAVDPLPRPGKVDALARQLA